MAACSDGTSGHRSKVSPRVRKAMWVDTADRDPGRVRSPATSPWQAGWWHHLQGRASMPMGLPVTTMTTCC